VSAGVVRTFRPGDEAAIRSIMEASLATDAIPGFEAGDIDRAMVRLPADPEGCLVASEGGRVVGYCIPRFDDLTVDPDFRRRGHGRRLVAAARELVGRRGLPFLQLHGPRHLPATQAFIAAVGARYHSSLWLFELAPEVEVPAAEFPADVVVGTFRADLELRDFVELMNATFADHPTPISWTEESVRLVHAQPDFDPHGILLVASVADPGRPVAYAKVELSADVEGRPKGWIAQLGVRPAWRGRGLGRELLRWGVGYLRGRGAGPIELAVEALNERATGLYRRTGFVPTVEWPHYVLDPAATPREAVPAG
jgi:mycothiol synthase